jgi:hypothetical protein
MTTVRRVGMPSPSNGVVPKPPEHGAVVDDGDVRSGNFFAEFAGQKRGSAIDRVSVHALENVFEHRACDHGIEHHRHMRCLYFARAQTPQRAACRFFPTCSAESSLARLRATEYQ